MKILNRKIEQAEPSFVPRTFGLGRRLLSLLLCLVLLVGLVPTITVPAEAASSGGQFLLRVGTGGNAGDNVRCFGIRYMDDKDILRTQYIYPQEGDADDIYKLTGNVDALNKRVNILWNFSGYQISGHENGFAMNGSGKSLQADTTDYFLFEPLHPFKKLIGIDVCMFYNKEKGGRQQWECTEMSFIKVKSFGNVNLAGYLSGEAALSFTGEILAQFGEERDGKLYVGNYRYFNLSKSDIIYRFSVNGSDRPMVFYDPGLEIKEEKDATYLFEIDFADIYGGGIEELAADNGKGGLWSVVEALTLDVWYTDMVGAEREVKIPVITSALTWAIESGFLGTDMDIIGIAQQGERLFFKGYFPNIKEFKSFHLIYGKDAAKEAGLKLGPTERQTERLNKLEKDPFNLQSFKIYGSNAINCLERDTTFSPASLYLKFKDPTDPTVKPIYQYTSPEIYGDVIIEKRTEICPGVGENAGSGFSTANLYIVSVTTDDFDLAATSDDVKVSLQYRSINGNLLRTQGYSLKEYAKEYFGYWPGSGDEASYRYALGPGKTLDFWVNIKNVEKFVGATFTIESSGTGSKIDDWQMSAMSIREYTEPSERRAYWTKDLPYKLPYTDRVFERDRNIITEEGEDKTEFFARYPNEVDITEAKADGVLPVVYLCTDTPSVSITFNGEGRSVVAEEEERDWDALRYSMTIAEAHQDLKFKATMCEYTVNVQVANNANDGLGNGDAGSDDLFYFMLDFRNGSSAYVLANQQLEADGFRSGAMESFSIKTNRDFGPLVSVHIIPEHSTDDNLFDKLNIKEIAVTKKSNEGIARTWKIENVGWIGSDYFDKGAESSIRGRPGRSENELAQVFKVTQEGYTANILFAMETASYGANPQLTGSITANIEYYDAFGEWHTDSFDVVQKMYEYAGIKEEEWDGLKDKNTGKYLKKLDPSFMVRGGKTDRFILAIPELSQVLRVTFHVRAKDSTVWNLKSLSMYTIESVGLLQINVDGEYQRSNKVTLLATSETGGKANAPASDNKDEALGAEQPVVVTMKEHEILVDMKTSAWTSTISREPVSNDDSLNVYVYPRDPISDGSYEMDMTVSCTQDPNDGKYQVSDKMTLTSDGTMFYALGVPARGIRSVKTLQLEANASGNLAALHHAVVQHVRSGVTISTYTFDLNGYTAAKQNKQALSPSASSVSTSQQEKQVVKLFFAEDTEEQVLEKETNDIVVAIRYTSTNDAQRTGQQTNGGGILYNSKYIYLSDLLELKQKGTDSSTQASQNGSSMSQKYTKIKPGMIAEIEFNEAYVGDIVGISLASIGSLRAHIQNACIQSESIVNGKTKMQWYNFVDEIYVDNAPQIMNKSTNERERVMPVRMTFNTEKSAINMGEGTGLSDVVPIRMEVFYRDTRSNTFESMTIEDLNTYLTDGGFQSGETATVEFFMENADSIRYIALEPHSIYSSSAAWKLESVNCKTWPNGTPDSYRPKTVNQEILQGNPVRVNLSEVTVAIATEVYSEITDTTIRSQMNSGADNPVLSVTLKPDRELTILPKVEGSLSGYGYKVVAVRGESAFGGEEVNCYRITPDGSDGTKIVFKPPTEQTQVFYAIRIASEEMPDIYCDVIVKAEAAPKIEEKTEIYALPENLNTGGGKSGGNGTGGNGTDGDGTDGDGTDGDGTGGDGTGGGGTGGDGTGGDGTGGDGTGGSSGGTTPET